MAAIYHAYICMHSKLAAAVVVLVLCHSAISGTQGESVVLV